jgi:RsmE family RNA methyltransferase
MKRIYNKSNLAKGNTYHLEEKYYIHLIKVMRLNIGERVNLFNEENGEWDAKIIDIKKIALSLKF